jgi:ferredoxin/flavodoxin
MKTTIHYFSGTGNTAWLADRLKEVLQKRGAAVSMGAVGLDDAAQTPDGPLTLIVCFPVYGLDAPPFVQEWTHRLPAGEGRDAVVVRSPGDPFFDGGTTRTMRRLLEERGWRVRVERMIVMPPNVFIRVSDDLAALLLAAAHRRIATLADDILNGAQRLEDTGSFVHYCSRACNLLLAHHGFRFGRDLRANKTCTRCGLCVRECPARTITMTAEGIRFGDRCQVCLRCVARCPVKAISSRFYSWFSVENYDLAALDAADLSKMSLRTWFERRYRNYLERA